MHSSPVLTSVPAQSHARARSTSVQPPVGSRQPSASPNLPSSLCLTLLHAVSLFLNQLHTAFSHRVRTCSDFASTLLFDLSYWTTRFSPATLAEADFLTDWASRCLDLGRKILACTDVEDINIFLVPSEKSPSILDLPLAKGVTVFRALSNLHWIFPRFFPHLFTNAVSATTNTTAASLNVDAQLLSLIVTSTAEATTVLPTTVSHSVAVPALQSAITSLPTAASLPQTTPSAASRDSGAMSYPLQAQELQVARQVLRLAADIFERACLLLSQSARSLSAGKWMRLCLEGQRVSVPAASRVRYGVQPWWSESVLSGSFVADNSTFHDVAKGHRKVCEIWQPTHVTLRRSLVEELYRLVLLLDECMREPALGMRTHTHSLSHSRTYTLHSR
jgi:hypothetical protein